MGSVLLGAVIALGTMLNCFIIEKRNYPKSNVFTIREFLTTFKEAIIGLIVLIILLRDIYSGKFTLTK